MTENQCYDYTEFYNWWLEQKKGKWNNGTLSEGQSKKIKGEIKVMIEQIPQCIYLISLGRTQIISTPVAKFSIHQINVSMFFGFESVSPTLKLASAEKAICDLLYLSPARSKLFTNLPEITFPNTFNKTLALEFIGKIQSPSRRKLALTRLNRLFALSN